MAFVLFSVVTDALLVGLSVVLYVARRGRRRPSDRSAAHRHLVTP